MTKHEFLAELRSGLSGLPRDEIDERLTFYSEMIDDRLEEGLSEEAAVTAAGPVDEIIAQAIADVPLTKLVKQTIAPKRKMRAWEIVLLVLGAPIWLSLLVAAFAVVFSIYVTLWSVLLSLWAIFASLAIGSVAGIAAGIAYAFRGNVLNGLVLFGAALVLAGLSVFMFFGCRAATKGILFLTKKLAIGIKNRFIKKEDAQ